jgi:hypothetical protein
MEKNAAAASKNLIRRFKTKHLLPLSVHVNPPEVLSFSHDEEIQSVLGEVIEKSL